MLVIRNEQMRALGRIPASAFEAQLVRHFFRFYPDECRRATEEQVRKMVRLGIQRASMHGYYAQREIALYINLMVILGCAFDRDPQIPWAAQQLNDPLIEDAFERIRRVYSSAMAYLEACFGAGNGQMVKALLRIRGFDLGSVPQSRGLQFQDDLCEVLRTFCPQKYAHQGEDANRELVRAGTEAAERYSISGNTGLTVYMTLMFMLGSGFDEDPLYPWAGLALTDTALPDEKSRIARLHMLAVGYVNDVLSEKKAG